MQRLIAQGIKLTLTNIYLVTLLFYPAYADNFAERKDVKGFIAHMVQKHNFKKAPLEKLFAQVKVRPQVIKSIKRPLEREPWNLYQMLFVNEWRIKHGVIFWKKYQKALADAEKMFGVPASIIVATIGIETRYGERTGDYRVMDSLSNIAFSDSTRANFFRKELEEFLLLTREQHYDPLKIMGSYAGAIGQPQFMPSSYRNYAINFSKSGQTDLMHDEVDVIGSIANYYQKHGWQTNEPVASRAMTVGSGLDFLMKKGNLRRVRAGDLAKYGIVPKLKINHDDMLVNIIQLKSSYNKEYWLGFHNFDVIKRYNASDLYAMAVFQLSNYIVALKEG